jgi:hypothetical protein
MAVLLIPLLAKVEIKLNKVKGQRAKGEGLRSEG